MSMGILMTACLWLVPGANPEFFPINQKNFQIPIHIDLARRNEMRQLVLYYSADQGKTWQHVAAVAPDKEAFQFFAPQDGLYWFSVCVVDQQGRKEPLDPAKAPPAQKILVDTLKPAIRFLSAERRDNEAIVSWDIQEENPDLNTLKLEYQSPEGPTSQWYPVQMNQAMRGEAKFSLPSTGAFKVRMQMADLAGNVGSATGEIPAGTPSPISTGTAKIGPVDPGGVARVSATTPPPGPPSSIAGKNWDGLPSAPAPVPPAPRPVAPPATEPSLPPPAVENPTGTSGSTPPAPASPPTGSGYPPSPASRVIASSEHTAASPAEKPSLPEKPGFGPTPESKSTLPIQIVNTLQIPIDYEVNQVGPSGIGKVELYVTMDDGETWKHFDDNRNLKPPFNVELQGEGVYGFTLVVLSKAGLGRKPPLRGEKPEFRVEVDTTPPRGQLFVLQPEPRKRDSQIISWNASDKNLDATPISLFWAERKEGPWEPIAEQLPNTGKHSWTLPPSVPIRVFLKMVVRDRPGNVCEIITPEPQLVDLSEPVARIKGLAVPSGFVGPDRKP